MPSERPGRKGGSLASDGKKEDKRHGHVRPDCSRNARPSTVPMNGVSEAPDFARHNRRVNRRDGRKTRGKPTGVGREGQPTPSAR